MSFSSTEELAEYQASREVLEALRVQSMSPEERFQWLQDTCGRLQDDATLLFYDAVQRPGTSRCFASFEEKNAFDEDQETKEIVLRLNGATTL